MTKRELAMNYYDTATYCRETLTFIEGQIELLLFALRKGRVANIEDGLNVLNLMVQSSQETVEHIVDCAGQKLKQVREEDANGAN